MSSSKKLAALHAEKISFLKEKDISLLQRVFQSQLYQSMLKVIDGIEDAKLCPNATQHSTGVYFARQVLNVLRKINLKGKDDELSELSRILLSSQCQAFLIAHDIIAAEQLARTAPTFNESELDLIKSITIQRQQGEILGATIRAHPVSGRPVIARILQGGCIYRSGNIDVGDEILEINGMDAQDLSLDDVVALLIFEHDLIHIKTLPSTDAPKLRNEQYKVFVRACFSYDPFADNRMPCPDAGLAFQQRDILEVMDTTELKWWQARKFGDKSMRIGLIPSKKLQEKYLASVKLELNTSNDQLNTSFLDMSNSSDLNTTATSASSFGSTASNTSILSSNSKKNINGKRRKRIRYDPHDMNKFHTHSVMMYEEVTQITPDPGRRRPVAIIGASGVGCSEVCRRLIELCPNEFKQPLQYMSKTKSHGKANYGYQLLKRNQITKGIQQNALIKQREIGTNLYAVSIQSIYDIQDQQITCIFEVDPWSLGSLKKASFIPYIIMVKCPTNDVLQTTRPKVATEDNQFVRTFTDAEFSDMAQSSHQIEGLCNHQIDLKVINEDLETTVNQIYHAVRRLSVEPQWVSINCTSTN